MALVITVNRMPSTRRSTVNRMSFDKFDSTHPLPRPTKTASCVTGFIGEQTEVNAHSHKLGIIALLFFYRLQLEFVNFSKTHFGAACKTACPSPTDKL